MFGSCPPKIQPALLGMVLLRPFKTFRAKDIVRMVQKELGKLPEPTFYGKITAVDPAGFGKARCQSRASRPEGDESRKSGDAKCRPKFSGHHGGWHM